MRSLGTAHDISRIGLILPVVRAYLGTEKSDGSSSDAVVIGYDITWEASFEHVLSWALMVLEGARSLEQPRPHMERQRYALAAKQCTEDIQRLASDAALWRAPPQVPIPDAVQSVCSPEPLLTSRADPSKVVCRVMTPRPVVVTLIGHKCDLEHSRRVPFAAGVLMAKVLSKMLGSEVAFFETSAKTGHNVTQAFDSILERAAALW